jgi:hypothetical protein
MHVGGKESAGERAPLGPTGSGLPQVSACRKKDGEEWVFKNRRDWSPRGFRLVEGESPLNQLGSVLLQALESGCIGSVGSENGVPPKLRVDAAFEVGKNVEGHRRERSGVRVKQ